MKKLLIILFTLFFFTVSVSAEEKYPYIIEDEPALTSTYVYLKDLENGQILYEKNSTEQMYPASMTKVMSCIVALENLDLDKQVTMTSQMFAGLREANASVAGLQIGQKVTVEDLLYCALLPSGADAINGLALTVSDSISGFVELMNQKAQQLEMTQTHFTNPTGLHNPEHYSCAKDMATLMEYACQNTDFVRISSTSSYTISTGLTVYSSIFRFLKEEIPGLVGGKTGFTGPAGRCLMSHGYINDMHLCLVTGQSENLGHLEDARTAYKWAQNYAPTEIVNQNDCLANIPVIDSKDQKTLSFYPSSSYALDLPLEKEIIIENTLPEKLYAPVEEGTYLGFYTVSVNGQVLYHEDFYVEKTIERHFFTYLFRQIKEFFAK